MSAAPAPAALLVTLTAADLAALIRAEVLAALQVAPPPPAPPSDWIKAPEAAALLGVSRDYVRRVPGLPRHGAGRAVRWRRSEVEAYLSAGRPRSDGA